MIRGATWIGALVLLVGCGAPESIVPVSGTVTLDGKPLADAIVGFEPIAKEGSLEAGYGSYGRTDDQGNFALKSLHNEDGALIGPHRVSISTVVGREASDGGMRGLTRERVPSRYNNDSELVFEVPPGGTDQAKLDLDRK